MRLVILEPLEPLTLPEILEYLNVSQEILLNLYDYLFIDNRF